MGIWRASQSLFPHLATCSRNKWSRSEWLDHPSVLIQFCPVPRKNLLRRNDQLRRQSYNTVARELHWRLDMHLPAGRGILLPMDRHGGFPEELPTLPLSDFSSQPSPTWDFRSNQRCWYHKLFVSNHLILGPDKLPVNGMSTCSGLGYLELIWSLPPIPLDGQGAETLWKLITRPRSGATHRLAQQCAEGIHPLHSFSFFFSSLLF